MTIKNKTFLLFFICFSCSIIFTQDASCAENYYIDNNRVLLYKIINWWYDCLPEETDRLCGSRLKYENRGNAKAEFNNAERTLKLNVKGGFTDLISIFKQCKTCPGPSCLKCVWLNEKYFKNSEAMNIYKNFAGPSIFVFKNITKKQARQIKNMEKNLIFVLEGTISGLINNKIALHRAGNFLKPCPDHSQIKNENPPIFLTIINTATNEILAKYSAISAD